MEISVKSRRATARLAGITGPTMKKIIITTLAIMLSACGGGGGGDAAPAPSVIAAISSGTLDGKWKCATGSQTLGQIAAGAGDTLQISGLAYYPYLGASAQTLSLNQGIITGPDTAHYGGAGSFASQLINDRIYPVIHLADKIGYAGIYSTQDAPIGRGREFRLNTSGNLVVKDYAVKFLYDTVFSDASGKAANLDITETTCTKA